MHGFYALHNWADFMDNRPDISFSFCESIYYHFEGNDIVPTHEYARPQDVNAYINGESLRPYLLADDVCIGAGLMTKTDVLKNIIRSCFIKSNMRKMQSIELYYMQVEKLHIIMHLQCSMNMVLVYRPVEILNGIRKSIKT